jgi:short-subunit dehydrogenase
MAVFRDDIRGSVIVVLGASSGFGRGAALKLVQGGAKVIMAARRGHVLAEMADSARGTGGEAIAVECDISRPDEVAAVARAAIDRFGRIDVWINNTGIGALGYFWDIPIEDQARVIDVNLKGIMYGAHAALRQFRAQGYGVLVNTGSIDSEVPLAFQTTYAATKAGVLSMSRSLNQELRLCGLDHAIKVATIMPWAVDTPWWTSAANYTGHQPRMAAMDDPQIVVDAIVRACTDPQEEMPVGPKAHASNISHHIFPDLTERLSANLAAREIKRADALPPTSGSIYTPRDDNAAVTGGVRRRMAQEDRR